MNKIEGAILNYLQLQVLRALERGEIRSMDPKIVSFVLLKLYIALTSDWNKLFDPLGKEEIKEFTRAFLAQGLAG